MQKPKKGWNNWLVLLGVVVLAIAPLFLIRDATFEGADGKAVAVIQEVQPSYQPWAKPLIEPASGEIASLLFAVQAALGAGAIGYVIGLYRGRRERSVNQLSVSPQQSDDRDS